jgi:cell division protein FtsN
MARQHSKEGMRLFKLLFSGVVIGLIAAAALAWFLIPRASDFRTIESAPQLQIPPSSIATPAPVEKPAEPVSPPPSAVPGAETGGNYTFYDILPGDKAPQPEQQAEATLQWWLQVAALRNREDADALRARLTLLNLNAVVQESVGETPLHRVRVGPFDSQAAAESAQEMLVVNKLEARLLKEPVTH